MLFPVFVDNDFQDQREDVVSITLSLKRVLRKLGHSHPCRPITNDEQENLDPCANCIQVKFYESLAVHVCNSALGDCWEGHFEVKKHPIPSRFSLIGEFDTDMKYTTILAPNVLGIITCIA